MFTVLLHFVDVKCTEGSDSQINCIPDLGLVQIFFVMLIQYSNLLSFSSTKPILDLLISEVGSKVC